MAKDIEFEIRNILSQELGLPIEAVEVDVNFREMPGIESIKLYRAFARVERQYSVQLGEESMFLIGTIAELATLIRDKR